MITELLTNVVAFPVETQLGILGLVGLALTLLFNFIGAKLPWTIPLLMKYKEEITIILAGLVTGWLSTILPGGVFEQASIWGVNFVVALLTAVLSYGVIKLTRNVKAKYQMVV
jgi:VIT1/CCC1 family predicted Fe2+/Mn2+ transporter